MIKNTPKPRRQTYLVTYRVNRTGEIRQTEVKAFSAEHAREAYSGFSATVTDVQPKRKGA